MTPYKAADTMITTLNDYDRFIQPYQAGIREINLRMEILKNDFSSGYRHNPIHYVQTRVKTMQSIYDKLEKRGYRPNFENAKNYLTDIAGVRIICYYADDIYTVVNALHKMHDLAFPRENDYIKTPKQNGYRSYHMIAVVPIHNISTEYYPVEIQLRTLSMDTWAGMEHQIRYKAQPDEPDLVTAELREYAEMLKDIEAKMEKLYLRMSSMNDVN
jgi:putative GTP pyrophosphokinase